MLRFIFNFFLFGIIFYLIYVFFPEAFTTLVSWAHATFDFLKEVFLRIGAKINEWRGQPTGQGTPSQQAVLFLIVLMGKY